MLRMLFRMGFWGSLALLAMPSSRVELMRNGVTPVSVYQAFQLASVDIGNFCARNLGICQTGQVVATDLSQKAKTGLLTAYHGIRNQYDEPDRTIMTGSVKKPDKP